MLEQSYIELDQTNHNLEQQITRLKADLARSKECEHAILDASPVPKGLINHQGKIIYLNPAFIQLFGYEHDDVPTLESWFEKVYPDTSIRKIMRNFWAVNLSLFLNGQNTFSKLERTVRCKDGTQRNVLMDMAVIEQQKNEKVIMVTFNDVTEIQKANALVQQQKQFLHTIIEAEPECLTIIDTYGQLQHINSAGLAIFEVENLSQISIEGILHFIDDKFKDDFNRLCQRACNGQSDILEFTIHGAHGTQRWLECHATPVNLNNSGHCAALAVSRDVTARKLAEIELSQRNNYLWLNNLVLKKLGENAPASEILNEMMMNIEDIHPGIYSSVLLVDKNKTELIHGAAPSLPQHWVEKIARVPLGEGMGSCGTAAYRGERVIVEDIATHPYWADFREDALINGLRACWSQPIKNAEGKVLGTFAIYLRHVASPSVAEISLLEDYTQLAQLVIERSQLAEALLESQKLYQLVAQNSTDVIWVMEYPSFQYSYVSPSVKHLRGWEPEEVLQHSLDKTLTPDMQLYMQQVLATQLQRIFAGDKTARFASIELELLHKDGHAIPVEMAVNIILNDKGTPSQIVGTTRNISERKAAETLIRNMAYHDLLTRLPNRRLMEDRLHQLVSRGKRMNHRMSVLYIDLDKFKPVNDQYGHATGDWLLQEVAHRMSSMLRETDTVARMGGDEFVILLPDVETAEYAMLLAEKIHLELKRPFTMINGVTLNISSSIGVVMYPEHAKNSRDLLRFGDEAMYRAKKDGGDKIELFQKQDYSMN